MEEKIKPVGNPPRGWHMMKEYIDDDGNVFHKGELLYTNAEREILKRVYEIKKRLSDLYLIKEQKKSEWDYDRTWDEFVELTKIEDEEIMELDRELRLIKPYKTTDMPDFGTVMTLNEFKNSVKNGVFIDYDGYGHYIETYTIKEPDLDKNIEGEYGMRMTDIPIYPSDVTHKSLRYRLNKIIWFNR